MPLNSSSTDLSTSDRRGSRRASAELARDLLGASGAGKIADSEGNTYDPVGSSAGPRESFLKTVGDNVKDKVGSVIGERALDPVAAAELQTKNPGAAAFLTSTAGVALEMVIFLVYVGLDMGKSIFNSAALGRHAAFAEAGHTIVFSSLLMTSSLLQTCLALGTIGFVEGKEGFQRLANPERFKKFFIVSVLFALANNFATLAYTELPAGTIKILGQCRLFETAILSRIIFNRRYSETQWMLMIIIIFGAILHIMAKQNAEALFEETANLHLEHDQRRLCHQDLVHLSNETQINRTTSSLQPLITECIIAPAESHDGDEGLILGIMYTFLYMLCSDIASIVSEMFLKSEKSTPFYIQKATMDSMGIPVLFATSFFGPWFSMIVGVSESRWATQMWWAREGSNFIGADRALAWCNNPAEHHGHAILCGSAAGGLWRDWGYWQPWGALFFTSSQSWFAGILVKLLSSVVKLLAKIVSLGGVFFIGDCWLLYDEEAGNLRPAGFAAIQVILLTFTFLNIKVPKEEAMAEPAASAKDAVELPEREKPQVV